MCSGIGTKSMFMPICTGIGYYFDCAAANPENNIWVNYMGTAPMTLYNADRYSDGAVHFYSDTSIDNVIRNCGKIVCDEPETVYIIAKIITQVNFSDSNERWSPIFAKSSRNRLSNYGFSFVTDADNYIYFGGMNNSVKSNVTADDYHVMCATRNTDGYVDLYIDGFHVGKTTNATVHGDYPGYLNINFLSTETTYSAVQKPEAAYKLVAVGNKYHSANDVAANSKWLMNKYNITEVTT